MIEKLEILRWRCRMICFWVLVRVWWGKLADSLDLARLDSPQLAGKQTNKCHKQVNMTNREIERKKEKKYVPLSWLGPVKIELVIADMLFFFFVAIYTKLSVTNMYSGFCLLGSQD